MILDFYGMEIVLWIFLKDFSLRDGFDRWSVEGGVLDIWRAGQGDQMRVSKKSPKV
jgi:hypothetical protein